MKKPIIIAMEEATKQVKNTPNEHDIIAVIIQYRIKENRYVVDIHCVNHII